MRPTITAIVCAYNEARFLPACLYSLLAQTRPPDEIIVVNNASTDETGGRGARGAGRARGGRAGKGAGRGAGDGAAARRRGDILAYVDADCRVPLQWLERVERRFERHAALVAVTGPYRFYDWDWTGRALIRAYDLLVAPPTHVLVHYVLGVGRDSLRRQLRRPARGARADRRLRPLDRVSRRGHESRPAADAARVDRGGARSAGSGRRRGATARWASGKVFGLYVRNFWSEILRHRPADREHLDVRA